MVSVPLPTFVGFMQATGPQRVTKVLEAQRLLDNAEPYIVGDHYFHLRRPLTEALLAGDPAPLIDCLRTLVSPKKRASYEAVVGGLTTFLRKHQVEAQMVEKRLWIHGDLEVGVRPTARLLMRATQQVAFVHLKADRLDARLAAPTLELLRQTHGDLGEPMIIEARTGKVFHPSRSERSRRGLPALLAGEAEAFVSMLGSIRSAA